MHELSVISSPGPLFVLSESISALQIDEMPLALSLKISIHDAICFTYLAGKCCIM